MFLQHCNFWDENLYLYDSKIYFKHIIIVYYLFKKIFFKISLLQNIKIFIVLTKDLYFNLTN